MRTLRIGSTGEEVIELQSTLSILKYKPGVTDGIFGVTTASAVIQFQKYNGFVPDGIVGPILWDAPADASSLNPEIFVSANNGYTNYSALNGSEIRRYLLTPGKHHIRVELRSGDRVIYQGSTDITIVPNN